MAKNWTIKEAVEAYKANDKESIIDIGRRFPLVANIVSGIVFGSADAVDLLIEILPEYNTLNRLNTTMKSDVEDNDSDGEAEDEKTEEKKPASKPAEKTEEKKPTGGTDYNAMNAQEIYKLGKERGIKFASTKKADMIAVMIEEDKKTLGKKSEKPASKPAEKDKKKDKAEETPYDGKDAKELYKLCKERGIKVEPKLHAGAYIELLLEADKEGAEDDGDWDDEDEKKDDKKSDKKSDKKKKEDEDWDI